MSNRTATIAIYSTLFLSSIVLFKSPFEFYLPYFVVILFLPFLAGRHRFPNEVVKIFFPLLVFGLISVYIGDNTIGQFMKIFVNLTVSAIFYNYVLQAYEFNVVRLTEYYMKGAYIVSLIGLFQVFSHAIGFTAGYDYSWILNKWSAHVGGGSGIRLNSIFSEPSYFGGSIAPAFFIATYNLLFNKNKFFSRTKGLVVILAYLLTFSTVAYAGVFIVMVVFLINFGFVRYVVVFVPVAIFSFGYLYANVFEFRQRIDGLTGLYSGSATSAFDVHGSSFVQFNNFHIAFENFKNNPLFGTGLGSHVTAYERYSLAEEFGGIYDFNSQDANSMALRLMSETGLFGLVFILIFIIKFFVLRDPGRVREENWLISGAMLTIILLQLFRQGNYTYNGFLFYMWVYYFNALANHERTEKLAQLELQKTIF